MATSHTSSTWDAAGGFQSGNGPATFPLGIAAVTPGANGVLNSQVSAAGAGNTADTNEDVLFTYSLPANTLVNTGKGLRITAWGKTAANADNKTMKLYFGSEVITTPTAATNNKGWWLELDVFRTGASTQQVFGLGQVDTTAVTVYSAAGAETETAAITIKVTGTAGTANANDILCFGMVVETIN